jgi:hypothetical protein
MRRAACAGRAGRPGGAARGRALACLWRQEEARCGGGALEAAPGELEKIGRVLRLVLARDLAEQREPDEQELEWRSSGAERGRVGEGARAEGLLRRAMGNRAAGRGRAHWGGVAQGARTPERGEEGWPQGSREKGMGMEAGRRRCSDSAEAVVAAPARRRGLPRHGEARRDGSCRGRGRGRRTTRSRGGRGRARPRRPPETVRRRGRTAVPWLEPVAPRPHRWAPAGAARSPGRSRAVAVGEAEEEVRVADLGRCWERGGSAAEGWMQGCGRPREGRMSLPGGGGWSSGWKQLTAGVGGETLNLNL